MNPDRKDFLNLRNLPGRCNIDETGWYLGFGSEDIKALTKAKLLKPLGRPSPWATKVYSLVKLRRLRENDPWMDKASEFMFKFWHTRNDGLKKKRKRKP